MFFKGIVETFDHQAKGNRMSFGLKLWIKYNDKFIQRYYLYAGWYLNNTRYKDV